MGWATLLVLALCYLQCEGFHVSRFIGGLGRIQLLGSTNTGNLVAWRRSSRLYSYSNLNRHHYTDADDHDQHESNSSTSNSSSSSSSSSTTISSGSSSSSSSSSNGGDGNSGGGVNGGGHAAVSALTTEQLFEEVMQCHLKTLVISAKCKQALVYLQSEREEYLQVVCRHPIDSEVFPEDEYIPSSCVPPEFSSGINPQTECVPKGITREATASGGLVVDCPITHKKEKDYFGILRVVYDAKHVDNGVDASRLITSIARSLAASIKLEHLHYNNAATAQSRAVIEDEEDIFDGIWVAASNSIKTMRTMLKMLARRDIKEGDDIGREAYDNLQMQLDHIGASMLPLRPDGDALDDMDMDMYDSAFDNDHSLDDGGKVEGAGRAEDIALSLRKSDLWSNNQVETLVVFDKPPE